jgi:arsenate reductase
MKKVLILCTENSCRSIIAEALINAKLEGVIANSAGVNVSGSVNFHAKRILESSGLWQEQYHSKTVDNVIDRYYDLVITVCDNAKEVCPIFPKALKVMHIGFKDPSGLGVKAFEKTLEEIEKKLLPQIKAIFA